MNTENSSYCFDLNEFDFEFNVVEKSSDELDFLDIKVTLDKEHEFAPKNQSTSGYS